MGKDAKKRISGEKELQSKRKETPGRHIKKEKAPFDTDGLENADADGIGVIDERDFLQCAEKWSQ